MIPGYESVELDLEKLFLLSVSKENLDLQRKSEKTLPYKKIIKNRCFSTCFSDLFV